jgi:hypothetical protein
MSKKQIILSQCTSQYISYSDFVFPYLDQIGLNNYECYHLYYCPWGIGKDYKDLLMINYQSDLIIWIIEDTLSESMNDYNWYSDKKPEALIHLERICRMYPKKKFILMSEQYKMNDLCTVNNLKFVDLTPYCFRFDRNKYKYNVCLKKLGPSVKNWICFNNQPRIHRILILSYVLSKNIDKFGYIFASSKIYEKIRYHKKIYSLYQTIFQFDIQTALKLNAGYKVLKNKSFEVAELVPYYFDFKFIDNYNNNLIEFYEKTKLELICSTTFSEPTLCFSEKELQCFYGRNFFIYFNSFGSIQRLREWGFDVFDDVVDHSYDIIEDPSERMLRAIDDNIHLLDGSTDLNKLWEDREERFNENCLVADNIQEKLDMESKKQILERLDEYSIPYKKQ